MLSIARYAHWAMAGIGALVLLGWSANIRSFTTLGTRQSELPSGALTLMVIALALSALRRMPSSAARVWIWAAVLLLFSLASCRLLSSIGPDAELWPVCQSDFAGSQRSLSLALTYLLFAIALAFALGERAVARSLTRTVALMICGITLMAVVEHAAYGVRLPLAVPSVGLALPAALAMFAGAASLLALRSSPHMLEVLEQDSPGGVILHRLLPGAVALPMLVGWVQMVGYHSGWFDLAAGESIGTILTIAACTAPALWISERMNELYARRTAAEFHADTQRELLAVTLASIDDAVITTDQAGQVSLANPAALALLGLKAEQVVGRPLGDILRLEDEASGAMVPYPLPEALEVEQTQLADTDLTLCLTDGGRRPVEVSALPIRTRDDSVVGAVTVLRDVGTRRARERALREANAELDRRVTERTLALERANEALHENAVLLETFAATTPELIIAKGRDGRITMINPAALRALGLTREQAVGRSKMELYGESEEIRHIYERDHQVLETGQSVTVEEHLITPRGPRTFLVTKSPLRDEHGRIFGLVGVATDITERNTAQRELERLLREQLRLRDEAERANRAKDEFLAIVSHELRSPLNALKGWSQLLSGSSSPDPILVRRGVQAIKRSVEHQARLIDDLLDTSRIINGKLTLERRPLNLIEVVLATLELSRTSALAKSIELRFLSDNPPVQTLGDPGRLQQVVTNLLSNAIKFTPDGGTIVIELRRSGAKVRLAVSDNGIGIDQHFLPHVFERFSQSDASIARRYSGLGLGLALVRHLVELHGGSVHAASPGSGLGSTFTVELPAAEGTVVPSPPLPAGDDTPPLGSLRGVQVVAVDDDPDAREVLQFALHQAGAHVNCFASGSELLAAIDRLELTPGRTILVFDIAMPGTDGFSVLARVRASEQLPFIPAIALTALTHLDRNRLTSAGFQDSLDKPIDVAIMINTIIKLLRLS